ncbi:MAG: polyprenyl synthetase family protein [Candidatus Kariarchaeaceae archaeon]
MTSTEQALDLLNEDRQLLITWLTEVINEEYKSSVLRDHILPIFTTTKSKKLRPLISLYVFRILAGEDADLSKLKPLCSAIEISHNASLLVDDIFDRDSLRRGAASFYVKYGTFAALAAAYNLSAFVFDLATRTDNHDVVREVGRVGTALSSALYMSKDLKSKQIITSEFFMNVLYRKTTALFEASANCGAMLANNDKEKIKKLTKFGNLFGNAYQLRDDVLAIIGNVDDLGKPPDSDITNRFQSLITIEAMKHGDPEEVNILEDFYLRDKDVNPEIIRDLLIKTGAVDKVVKYTLEYRDKALEILNDFPPSRSRDMLIALSKRINFQAVKTTLTAKNI